jgi:hypothetical protein
MCCPGGEDGRPLVQCTAFDHGIFQARAGSEKRRRVISMSDPWRILIVLSGVDSQQVARRGGLCADSVEYWCDYQHFLCCTSSISRTRAEYGDEGQIFAQVPDTGQNVRMVAGAFRGDVQFGSLLQNHIYSSTGKHTDTDTDILSLSHARTLTRAETPDTRRRKSARCALANTGKVISP